MGQKNLLHLWRILVHGKTNRLKKINLVSGQLQLLLKE
uniref:Uncharacterized protein n=1 Tax=Myoviridae sp. ctjhW4 TaxID=2825162 RepID=A0A8S5PT51_9CAUD|nr:MAG TPA: hypothetical protein [Myoviridae sp. ctjhW4]